MTKMIIQITNKDINTDDEIIHIVNINAMQNDIKTTAWKKRIYLHSFELKISSNFKFKYACFD